MAETPCPKCGTMLDILGYEVGRPNQTHPIDRCRDVLHAQLTAERAKVEEARSIVRGLLGWAHGGECSDCTPYRSCPADIEWQHESDCGHLVEINKAMVLLGWPPEPGYDRAALEKLRGK